MRRFLPKSIMELVLQLASAKRLAGQIESLKSARRSGHVWQALAEALMHFTVSRSQSSVMLLVHLRHLNGRIQGTLKPLVNKDNAE